MQFTWDLGPASLLFLSCDLVGSTAYKQGEGRAPGWARQFLEFYRDFPRIIGALSRNPNFVDPQFQLWKVVGDEMIFTCVVRTEGDVANAVGIWIMAMRGYEEQTSKKDRMQTHGGAFIGTFPGPDSHVFIERDPSEESAQSQAGAVEMNEAAKDTYSADTFLFDYLGPSIDTGFRVIAQSTARFFTLSVEVAWAIAEYQDNNVAPWGIRALPLDLIEWRELKGVWNARPYPIFAVDRQFSDAVHEAERALHPPVGGRGAIAAICAACSATSDWPSALFLEASTNPSFTHQPEDTLDSQRETGTEGAETPPSPDDEGSTVDPDLPTS